MSNAKMLKLSILEKAALASPCHVQSKNAFAARFEYNNSSVEYTSALLNGINDILCHTLIWPGLACPGVTSDCISILECTLLALVALPPSFKQSITSDYTSGPDFATLFLSLFDAAQEATAAGSAPPPPSSSPPPPRTAAYCCLIGEDQCDLESHELSYLKPVAEWIKSIASNGDDLFKYQQDIIKVLMYLICVVELDTSYNLSENEPMSVSALLITLFSLFRNQFPKFNPADSSSVFPVTFSPTIPIAGPPKRTVLISDQRYIARVVLPATIPAPSTLLPPWKLRILMKFLQDPEKAPDLSFFPMTLADFIVYRLSGLHLHLTTENGSLASFLFYLADMRFDKTNPRTADDILILASNDLILSLIQTFFLLVCPTLYTVLLNNITLSKGKTPSIHTTPRMTIVDFIDEFGTWFPTTVPYPAALSYYSPVANRMWSRPSPPSSPCTLQCVGFDQTPLTPPDTLIKYEQLGEMSLGLAQNNATDNAWSLRRPNQDRTSLFHFHFPINYLVELILPYVKDGRRLL